MIEEIEEKVNILKIPDNTGYWLLRADGGKYYDDFFLNNFVAISDNKITLEMLQECQDNSIAGITIDHYKELYRGKYSKWSNQQIAHAASRTEKFCDEMKIGDLLLVPAKRSTHFLIGIIVSEVYEISEEEVTSGEKVHYAINPYLKRRNVHWLKEVSRAEVSEKLYWILSAHQTIFDLQREKNYVNQLLSPIFFQNGVCHGTLKISKKEGINQDEWYALYSAIKKYTDQNSEEVIIKSNVQSPGLLEFVSNNTGTVIAITVILSGTLIGDVNFIGFKFKGIIPYIQSHKKQNQEMKKTDKEIELMEEDKRTKQLENDRTEFELSKEKEIWQIKKETEAEQLRQQLQISNFDAGRIIEDRTQTDNSENPNVDEL
ncbi:hypothetical protein JUJ52_03715 [Virgibacillus sp. AGTR]|uniref:hypothetical protein n=1 Tax=Virgibacillus sp. AGTR TaxID=2812055 RepID=UPI001D169AFC|nr:hypothetical protein [Virgibacillus sp. AGTR]MCC2249066.1 hypothetical protein [Virgibacillus sp. AGTR]